MRQAAAADGHGGRRLRRSLGPGPPGGSWSAGLVAGSTGLGPIGGSGLPGCGGLPGPGPIGGSGLLAVAPHRPGPSY